MDRYISQKNNIAAEAILKLGGVLSPTVKEYPKDDWDWVAGESPYWRKPEKVFEVSGGVFETMSGNHFNKWLRKNKLLMHQSNY